MGLPSTAADYRALAQRRLPRFLFDYVDGGAGDERTLKANVDDFARLRLRQRVLVDVDGVDTRSTLAGEACSLPLALAPIGLAGMMARRGEAQAARVAEAAGVPFTLSTVGICPLAEVRAARSTPFWFQLYMLRDRGVVSALLDDAWAAGCRTLVFTVDLPLPGLRHRDTRNGLEARGVAGALLRLRQVLARPGWVRDVALGGKPLRFGSLSSQVPDANNLDAFKAWVDSQFDPGVTWRDIEWLRTRWQGRLLLKGILDVEDAGTAVDIGADGIMVSNHGGRQLDSVASSISMLSAIAQAVGTRTEILIDGGVRGGTDIFKALALGANGVLIGRPWVWALAGAGADGLHHYLTMLQRELHLVMTFAGVTRISDIDASCLDAVSLYQLAAAGAPSL
ncbi:L-lactate dehydrogenase [Xanthomonadaceae bacterium XH05]|nr:L-lactate dehydrogenase [Xanthomonadaceae bacterium XH05]